MNPPAALKIWPVMWVAAGLARKTYSGRHSRAVPGRGGVSDELVEDATLVQAVDVLFVVRTRGQPGFGTWGDHVDAHACAAEVGCSCQR